MTKGEKVITSKLPEHTFTLQRHPPLLRRLVSRGSCISVGQTWRSHHPLNLDGESGFAISLSCRVRQKLPTSQAAVCPCAWPVGDAVVALDSQLPCPTHPPALVALAPGLSKKRVRAASLISSFFHFSCVAPTHLTGMPAGLAGAQRCLLALPEEAASGSGWLCSWQSLLCRDASGLSGQI